MITQEPIALMEERLEAIQGIVKSRHAVRVEELCTELGVSPATIRRDLTELHRLGHIRKVHGGAVSTEGRLTEPPFDDKESEARAEKDAIARAALTLIQPNDSIYLDGGSTVLALARLLTQMHPLTVVTNSLRVALALAGGSTRLILVGGDLRRLSQTFVGPLTQATIEQLHVDKAFMGTIGLSVDAGMTTTDPAEAFTKRLVMQHATQIVLLADSRKMGKVAFAQAGHLDQLDILITDPHLDPHLERQLKRLGVDVTIAPLPNAKE
jgi:DeoR/GlpR family transcriptional regulator of sugar metabolism